MVIYLVTQYAFHPGSMWDAYGTVIRKLYGTHADSIWNSHMETIWNPCGSYMTWSYRNHMGCRVQTTSMPICSPDGVSIWSPYGGIWLCYWESPSRTVVPGGLTRSMGQNPTWGRATPQVRLGKPLGSRVPIQPAPNFFYPGMSDHWPNPRGFRGQSGAPLRVVVDFFVRRRCLDSHSY